jgi:hypothetical protein
MFAKNDRRSRIDATVKVMESPGGVEPSKADIFMHIWGRKLRCAGLRRSAVRWKLVERLRRISAPVRRGNRNVATAIFN